MYRVLTTTLLLLATSTVADIARGEQPKDLRAIYFGNSFLENSVPWFHPTLARSAGHGMQVQAHLGPGWQIWMHVNTFHTNPERSRKSLLEDNWDAVVIQHFGSHSSLKDNVRASVFHNQEPFPEPRDVSDFASASAIIELFLSQNPAKGRAFMFCEHPKALDYTIYNDLKNYTNENIKALGFGGYVHQPDLGVLLEITPERAQIVNDTIWEAVTHSPSLGRAHSA